MRKKILAVAAATVMTLSMAIPAMAAAPTDYAGYYSFDDTLDNAAAGGKAATLTGPKVTVDATATAATFVAGSKGKAVSFTGAGSYGLNLGKVLTGNEYTISFMTQVHAGTFATPWVFIESMKGVITAEDWIAIQPVSAIDNFETDAPRIWSMQNGTRFEAKAQFHHDAIKTDNWYNITFVMTEKVGTLYVNGEAVAKAHVQDPKATVYDATAYGFPPNVVKDETNVYLGVNYWDDPLNGEIDELYLYNRALTNDELKDLIGSEIKDTLTLQELESTDPPTTNKVELENKDNADFLSTSDKDKDDDEGLDPTIIIIAAAVVVVVVVIVVVAVAASKKKNAGSDDDDE